MTGKQDTDGDLHERLRSSARESDGELCASMKNCFAVINIKQVVEMS